MAGFGGVYNGVTAGSAWGFGVGLFADINGNYYPQLYVGTPGVSATAGYASNLEEFLTGISISGSIGPGNYST